jgi:hypothetical protein
MDFCKITLGCQFIMFITAFTIVILFQDSETITGHIIEILADTTSNRAVIVLDIFHVLSTRHDIFGMPMLARRHDETTYIVIPSTVHIYESPNLDTLQAIIFRASNSCIMCNMIVTWQNVPQQASSH